MKIQERYLWIAAIILCAFIAQDQSKKNGDFEILIKSYELESQVQSSQIVDMLQSSLSAQSSEYLKGFESGRSQAGIALVNGRPMLDYADGYHAALEQFSENHVREDEKLIRKLEADIDAMVKGG